MSTYIDVYIDWHHDVWSDTPLFDDAIDDISAYVMRYRIHRGVHKEFGNVISGVLDLPVTNSTGRFSPSNASSPLYGNLKPWRPVQLVASEDGGDYTLYRGFVSSIRCYPHLSKQQAFIRCTDGLDLIARHILTLDKESRTSTSPGGALTVLLNGMGWPAALRDIDTNGASLKYPAVLT